MPRCKNLLLIAGLPLLAFALPTFAAGDGTWKDGEETYKKVCAYCHDAGVSPILRGRQLPPELIKHFVRNGSRAMPAFRITMISDADLDAMALWLQKSPAPSADEKIPQTSAAGNLPAKDKASTSATDSAAKETPATKAADATSTDTTATKPKE